jgi:hypothetical protein
MLSIYRGGDDTRNGLGDVYAKMWDVRTSKK